MTCVPVSHAAPPSDGRLPVVTLGKKTIIRATTHSHALLEFTEDVPLVELKSSVSGGGRVVGYALTNWSQEAAEDDFLVYSFAFNRCTTVGCADAGDPLPIRVSSGLKNGLIPAGTYDLYVIADRAPVVITFKDHHLQGRSESRLPGNRFDVDLRTLPMRPASAGDGAIFSGGDFTSLEPGRGLGLLGLWALGPSYVGGLYGGCFYFDDLLVAHQDAAFPPGCPTASGHRYPFVPAQPGQQGGVVYESSYQDLPRGIGGWTVSAGSIDNFGAVGLWLRF